MLDVFKSLCIIGRGVYLCI